MLRMIPAEYGKNTNFGEKQVFDAFNGVRASDDWIVLHGLDLAHTEVALEGESDDVVMVPGAGIVVIESKIPQGGRCEVFDKSRDSATACRVRAR